VTDIADRPGTKHHAVYPLWQEAQHDLFSASCSCHPRIDRQCSECDGAGCDVCSDGWIQALALPAPDVPAIIVHYVLPGGIL
jgi:hypothetical protein